MNRVPRILGSGEIRHTTFYQWVHLRQCVLKGAVKVVKFDGALPGQVPTRAVLVGRFYHRAMELAAQAASAAELVERLDAEIVRLQAAVNQWVHFKKSGAVSGWDEVNRAAALARRAVPARSGTQSFRAQQIELELRSKDARLVGRPDLVSIARHDAVLREYKSGPIRDADGRLVDTHLSQLLFYSYLVLQNFEIERVVCYLQSLTGDSHQVTVEKKHAEEFADQVLQLVDQVNTHLVTTRDLMDLARPSKDACSDCVAQVVCQRFKLEQHSLGLEGAQFVLEGTIRSMSACATGALANVVFTDHGGRTIGALAIPMQECKDILLGARYLILGLRRHGGALAWDHTSRIFQC